jgi:hypothetical protein
MHSRSSLAVWPRRALAVAGLAGLGTGLLLLTAAAHPTQAAASASSTPPSTSRATNPYVVAGAHRAPATHKSSRAADRQFETQVKAQVKAGLAGSHSSATVTGPHMYNPATGKPFPAAATVTVSQTTSLVDQQVQVSWTNFTPSSSIVYTPSNLYYPVMVAECKGTDPASPADCYAAQDGGVRSQSGSEGPPNTSYATSGPTGVGEADIETLTGQEIPFLGCDQGHPCSLAIVPAQGGDILTSPPDCNNHQDDEGFSGTATGAEDFGSVSSNGYICSWAKRIVVPLTFARTAKNCSFKNTAFSASGSPMLARAMNSWVARLCEGSGGISINYSSADSEPEALTALASGSTDVALTTRPAAVQGVTTGSKHYVYAPIAISAASIAYWFDNPTTGLAQGGVKLDQLLMLKLLTQSYGFLGDACQRGVPPPPLGCDNGVDGDPGTLFTDPEFTALDPNIVQPTDGSILMPTVLLGQSDMTWTVTSWIDANTAAKDFLAGQYDQWAEHLNTAYLGLTYPNNSFVGQDNYIIIQHEFFPVFPLSALSTDQVEDWPPGDNYIKDFFGNYDRLPPQIPGQRALLAITDEADSAAYLFPVAAIPNASGNYVRPTNGSMLAALQGATKEDGTLQVNPSSTNKKAYPLTMVIYAAVPTSGTPHAKAAAIARFLDYAAGPGQTSGLQPGNLPPGFAPLPASMRAQTRKDAREVLRQTGASAPTKTTNPGTGGNGSSGSPNPSSSPGSVSLPAATPSPGAGNGVSLVAAADARPASITRYILPALLILGGLAALAGSSSLIGSSSTPITARLRRIGQGGAAWSHAARKRLGLRRSK